MRLALLLMVMVVAGLLAAPANGLIYLERDINTGELSHPYLLNHVSVLTPAPQSNQRASSFSISSDCCDLTHVVQHNGVGFGATNYDTDQVPLILAQPPTLCPEDVDPQW
jgi:hypothetical protein